jgi:hydroxypyruvate isomerase
MGGMERLAPRYRHEAERLGMELRLFNTSRTDIQPRHKGVACSSSSPAEFPTGCAPRP